MRDEIAEAANSAKIILLSISISIGLMVFPIGLYEALPILAVSCLLCLLMQGTEIVCALLEAREEWQIEKLCLQQDHWLEHKVKYRPLELRAIQKGWMAYAIYHMNLFPLNGRLYHYLPSR